MTEKQQDILNDVSTADMCSVISSREQTYKDETRRLSRENAVLRKALHLYVDWADECGIAWDNFPDMEEKWYKVVEEKGLGWIDGLVFMAIEEAKEQLNEENSDGVQM